MNQAAATRVIETQCWAHCDTDPARGTSLGPVQTEDATRAPGRAGAEALLGKCLSDKIDVPSMIGKVRKRCSPSYFKEEKSGKIGGWQTCFRSEVAFRVPQPGVTSQITGYASGQEM